MSEWCILRTSAGSTIALAEALADAGFTVWTPTWSTTRNALRKEDDKPPLPGKKGREIVKTPMARTFVFADAARLPDLLSLARSPSQNWQRWDSELRRMVAVGIPHFTPFRYLGEYPIIPDAALEPMRRKERQRKPRGIVKAYKVGDRVKLLDGGFAGMSGVVELVKSKSAVVVSFPGYPQTVTFPAWVLLDDGPAINVNGKKSELVAP